MLMTEKIAAESEAMLIIICSGKYTSSNCQISLYSTTVPQFVVDGKVWGTIPEQFFLHSQVLLFPPGGSDVVFITFIVVQMDQSCPPWLVVTGKYQSPASAELAECVFTNRGPVKKLQLLTQCTQRKKFLKCCSHYLQDLC